MLHTYWQVFFCFFGILGGLSWLELNKRFDGYVFPNQGRTSWRVEVSHHLHGYKTRSLLCPQRHRMDFLLQKGLLADGFSAAATWKQAKQVLRGKHHPQQGKLRRDSHLPIAVLPPTSLSTVRCLLACHWNCLKHWWVTMMKIVEEGLFSSFVCFIQKTVCPRIQATNDRSILWCCCLPYSLEIKLMDVCTYLINCER